jgi:hypothetical protein
VYAADHSSSGAAAGAQLGGSSSQPPSQQRQQQQTSGGLAFGFVRHINNMLQGIPTGSRSAAAAGGGADDDNIPTAELPSSGLVYSDAAATAAAEALLAESMRRGTMDNVTVIVMLLQWS